MRAFYSTQKHFRTFILGTHPPFSSFEFETTLTDSETVTGWDATRLSGFSGVGMGMAGRHSVPAERCR